MKSLETALAATGYRPSGFDYERVILAIGVIAWHSVFICYGAGSETIYWTGPLRALITLIVPSFFALSGFLVAGSLARNDLPSFLTLRSIRIFPALGFEVLLSALILGPLVTTLPLSTYFSDPMFWRYFQNIVGDIHYLLPGVFLRNPGGAGVNLQLWTVPYELLCYVSIAVIGLLGINARPKTFLGILLAVTCVAVAYKYQLLAGGSRNVVPSRYLSVLSFLFGVCLFSLRHQIPFSRNIFAASAVLTWLFLSYQQLEFFAPLPLAYATIYLGLQNPARNLIVWGADYSYGLYLFGCPVQQTLVHLFPSTRIWIINFSLSVVVTGIFAALSWHFVESRVLAYKKTACEMIRYLFHQLPVLRRLVVGSAPASG